MIHKKHQLYGLALAGFLLLLYVMTAFNVTISNDSVTNVEQIASQDIMHRSSHFGFIFLGVMFYKIFALFGIHDAVISTQFMLSFFSVLGSLALFFLALKRSGNEKIALVSVVIYALSSNIWRFSIQNEYHVLIPALGLLAIALWEFGFWILGGLFFTLSFVTSPFVIFMIPFAIPSFSGKGKRPVIYSAAGFVFLYSLIAFFTIKETLYGDWSYKLIFDYHIKSLLTLKPLRVFAIWLYGYLRSFHFLFPFLILSFIYAFRKDRRIFYLLVASVIAHIPPAIPELRYGAYQMTFYPFLAFQAASMAFSYSGRMKVLFFTCMGLFLCMNLYIVNEERNFQHQLADTYRRLQHDNAIADSSTVLMYQATKPFNVIYAPRLNAVSIFTGYQEKQTDNLENYDLPDYQKIGNSSQVLYMLESGTSMPDDRLKLLVSGFVKSQGAKLKGFGLEKVKDLYPNAKIEAMKGYELPVYRVTNP